MASASDQAHALEHGAAALGVPLDTGQRERLLAFLRLLERWNRAYNLTAVRDPAQMVARHLLDSLSIAPLLHGRTLLDVGSGAGPPGLVLAVARPHAQVTLLDPSLKRTRFLTHAVQELGLGNVSVVRARLEEHAPGGAVDNVTSRAALGLDRLAAQAPRLLAPGGRLVAMLGRAPPAGTLTMPPGWHLELRPLRVPGVDGARHAAIVCRQDAPH